MRPRPPAAVTAEASLPPAANAMGAEMIGCVRPSCCVSRVFNVTSSAPRVACLRHATSRTGAQQARAEKLSGELASGAKVGDEGAIGFLLCRGVGNAQQIRRMHGDVAGKLTELVRPAHLGD